MLKVSSQRKFDKDFERMKKRGNNLKKLGEVIELLANEKILPAKNCNHKLIGEFKGCWECHVEPDWLLVYRKTSTELILMRMGKHSDLF